MRRCHQELNTCDCLLSLSDKYHNDDNDACSMSDLMSVSATLADIFRIHISDM